MYEIWANLGLLVLALIAGGILWLVLVILSKVILEDFLGGILNKIRRKQKRDDDDYYVY
jgi:hypothetical protein